MTMEENREMNQKILKNVRAKIVVSNLESEENMKLSKRKQAFSICTAIVLVLSGGFLTVNATTDGKLVEDIKDKIVIKINHDDYKITTSQDENGEEIYTVHINEDEEMKFEVYEDGLKQENLQTIIEEGKEGPELTFYHYE